jgi:type IV pilus assembly protein PilV
MLNLVRQNRWRGIKRQGGTTLMEVLVSLLVLSAGMLGMAGLQTVSLRNNQSAYFRTQATALSLDMVERLRANISGVEAGTYNNVAGGATASCFTVAGCNGAQMAGQDILDWEAQVAAALPGGQAVVCLDSTGNDGTPGSENCDSLGSVYAIKIWWDDNRDGTANQRYVTTAQPW